MINDLRVVDSQQIVDEYPCIVSEHHLRFCCCCCFVHSGQMDVSLELPCKYEIEMERKQQAAEELDPDANLHTCIYIYVCMCMCVFCCQVQEGFKCSAIWTVCTYVCTQLR